MPLKTTVTNRDWTRRAGRVLLALIGFLSTTGCDSDSFVPPPPAELSKGPDAALGGLSGDRIDPAATASRSVSSKSTSRTAGLRRTASVGSARIIELLLARPADDDRNYLVQVLRREAGKARMVFRIVQPESGASFSPEAIAKEIRAAVARGASGLIVEPLDGPAIGDALHEAVSQGMAVLLLDRPVASAVGQSIPFIRYGPLPDAGRAIVQAALEAVSLFDRAEPDRIILLHHSSTDAYAGEQMSSLTDSLKAAGKSFSLIEFQTDALQAVDLLKKSLAADPRLDLVLADDHAGMSGAQHVLTEWTDTGHPTFLVAGYLAYDIRTSTEMVRNATAYGDRSVEAFGLKTFQTVQSLLDGKPVGDRVDVPISIHKKTIMYVPTPANSEKAPASSK
jgi:ABC-type sugar transport system substrate-binding protein